MSIDFAKKNRTIFTKIAIVVPVTNTGERIDAINTDSAIVAWVRGAFVDV